MKKHLNRTLIILFFLCNLLIFALLSPLRVSAEIDCEGSVKAYAIDPNMKNYDCKCVDGKPDCKPRVSSSGSSSKKGLSSKNQLKLQVMQSITDAFVESLISPPPGRTPEELEQAKQAAAQAAALAAAQAAANKRIQDAQAQAEHDKMMNSYKQLDGTHDTNFKPLPDSNPALKTLDGEMETLEANARNMSGTSANSTEPVSGRIASGSPTPFFGTPMNDPNVVDLSGKKGIVDPNDLSLGKGKEPASRNIGPTGEEVISDIYAQAKRLGWSEAKLKRLKNALSNLDLDDKDWVNSTLPQIEKIWQDVDARSLNKILVRDVSQGVGPNMPVGAGLQTNYSDCTIFALANAARLPYGFVAARATEIVRNAAYRSTEERADPQKAIEARRGGGLNGGEVTLLAETFGQADVVPPAAFVETLKKGRPILVGLVYPTRDPDPNKDPLARHKVVLTKTFIHQGERWYEMMNSQQDTWKRQYLSEKELRAILDEKGVAYIPEPGTVVKTLK